MQRILKFDVIEVSCAAGTRLVNFPDQPQLRNARVLAVDYLAIGAISVSPLTGGVVLPLVDSERCFVELWQGNNKVINRMPLALLTRTQNDNGSIAFPTFSPFVRSQAMFNGQIVSWTKSQLVFQGAVSVASIASFGVTYEIEGE